MAHYKIPQSNQIHQQANARSSCSRLCYGLYAGASLVHGLGVKLFTLFAPPPQHCLISEDSTTPTAAFTHKKVRNHSYLFSSFHELSCVLSRVLMSSEDSLQPHSFTYFFDGLDVRLYMDPILGSSSPPMEFLFAYCTLFARKKL